MLKIQHIKNNKFKIIHNKKNIEVTILNLFKEVGCYANILHELKYNNMTKDNYFSLICDFNIYIDKNIIFKNKDSIWCDVSEYYKEELIFYIIDNKEYFNNLSFEIVA